MDIEDKILLYRGIIGAIAGVISAFTNSVFIAIIPIIAGYIISLALASLIFKISKLRVLITKGSLIMIIAWFLMLVIVYNILD
ncbi:hypothetical protein DFR86_07050 [Acidianus sulfidivorans JP7]|uniref:Uncharacterized protein n=1 Tax=Acidianus sulfidivorans JP7 TaxID=619593 RepID=A0A2U9IMV4_9CREN|nr:hypothetical protein [Acidianus sulfidivorans]AWR97330.1 hypothetical protein DFR86_07050 [Acidianus sulfidivorans JP7]